MHSRCFPDSSIQKKYQAAVVSALATSSLHQVLTAKTLTSITVISFPLLLFPKTTCQVINFKDNKTYMWHILLLHSILCASYFLSRNVTLCFDILKCDRFRNSIFLHENKKSGISNWLIWFLNKHDIFQCFINLKTTENKRLSVLMIMFFKKLKIEKLQQV